MTKRDHITSFTVTFTIIIMSATSMMTSKELVPYPEAKAIASGLVVTIVNTVIKKRSFFATTALKIHTNTFNMQPGQNVIDIIDALKESIIKYEKLKKRIHATPIKNLIRLSTKITLYTMPFAMLVSVAKQNATQLYSLYQTNSAIK